MESWMMRSQGMLRVCVLLVLCFLGVQAGDAVEIQGGLSEPSKSLWTPEQQAWLHDHPVIRVGIDPDYPPYEYVDRYKQPQGVSSDYLKALAQMLGVRFEVIPDLSWQQVVEQAKKTQLDVVSAITPSPNRHKFLLFTEPYIPYETALVSQETQHFSTLKALKGRRVALVKSYVSTELVLRKQPNIIPIYVDTVLDALKAVVKGDAVATIGDMGSLSYKMRTFAFSTLKVTGFLDLHTQGLAIGVRDDWPILRDILNIALQHISAPQRDAIMARWLGHQHNIRPAGMHLTAKEQAFIQAHPHIRLGIDPEFIPFEFINKQGVYSGMASDYIKLLNQRLGLHMQVVYSKQWKKTVQKAKQRELDVLPCVGVTDERKRYFLFSKPYIYFNRVVITRTDSPFMTGLQDLEHLKVAVQANSSHAGYLREHSDITPKAYATLEDALRAVSGGQADAFVGNLAASVFWIRKLNLVNLKVSASLAEHDASESLHFAVRKDWPELVAIIDKGLASISDQEHDRISRKWVDIHLDSVVDYMLIGKIIGTCVVLILLVLLWNARIRKQQVLAQEARAEAESAKARLEESHMKLAAIFDSASAGIVVMKNRVITNCNHRMDDMYGCAYGEQIGKTTRMWYPSVEVYEQVGHEVAAHVSRGETYVGELLATRKDGSQFWARASVRAMDGQDVSKGLVAVVEDISDERQMIEDMRHSQQALEVANVKLKELDQLKSMFIASMSHELRTPLNSIIGFSGLLLQGVSGPISDEQREDVGRIYHSGKHLLDLITDVIDISKIEADRVEVYPTSFAVHDLVHEAEQVIQPQLQEKGLALDVQCDVDMSVRTDRKRLFQCLLNLMSNAVKYSEQGQIRVRAWLDGDDVLIAVSDTGIGIPDAQLPKLFEAFERLDSHLKVKAGGTGLGLYLTKKIMVDLLEGSIDVVSQEHVGSTFTLKFPRYMQGDADHETSLGD